MDSKVILLVFWSSGGSLAKGSHLNLSVSYECAGFVWKGVAKMESRRVNLREIGQFSNE